MKATHLLHNLGQSIWLYNITRDPLNIETLKHYIAELSVAGLTSNPTIFDHAFKSNSTRDASIREKLEQGKSGEAPFFDHPHTMPESTLKAPGEHQPQGGGAKAFVKSWHELMDAIGSKSVALAEAS